MKKRITAALLSVVLCLALLGTTALGAEGASVAITAKADEAAVTVTANGLKSDTDYNMCAIGRGSELLALFNAKTDANGHFEVEVTVGALNAGETLSVTIPALSGNDPIKGGSTVEESTTPPPPTTYTITVSAGTGGSISPSGNVSVAEGGNKTFSITPNANYAINNVTVDGSPQGKISSYTFNDVRANHTISATFTYTGGGSDGGDGGGSSGGGGGGSSSSNAKAPDVSKNSGGSVKVSSDGKTVTITPNDGYRVKDVLINGKSVGAVTKYVFDKASKDNTVEVIFEKIADETKPTVSVDQFTDVSSHWAKSAIAFAVERGLFNGVSDNQFAPDATMTRSMLVTVLHRLEHEPAGGNVSFADVPSGQWYTQAVAWASSQGIVQGTGDGFDPNGNITREQLAAILYRYAALKGLDMTVRGDLSAFPDGAGVSAWAGDAMAWAVGAGILNGNDVGALNPGGNATRAEVATMLMRFVSIMD